jgi:hypothetical protein
MVVGMTILFGQLYKDNAQRIAAIDSCASDSNRQNGIIPPRRRPKPRRINEQLRMSNLP